MLEISTIGALSIQIDGKELNLPASRKTRALIGFLAISGTSHSRQALCELFWEIPDDPRAALRWSLTKLRPILNSGGTERVLANRERVAVDLSDVDVDFTSVRKTVKAADVPVEELIECWEQSEGILLENCELPGQLDYMTWLEQQRNELLRLRVAIARRLAQDEDLDSSARDRWAERWLVCAPHDTEAAIAAVMARRATGQEQAATTLARKLISEFEHAGLPPPDFESAERTGARNATLEVSSGNDTETAPPQSIRFALARDGVSIAWARVGKDDRPPLVKAANWLNHLELDWDAPIWSPLFREFSRSHSFVRYDERGCGMSDWDVEELTFESFVTDLELVADAAGLDRFPLLGISQGAAVSIEFAARHPERVSHLILFGGYDAGWRVLADKAEVREREAVMVLTETGWGSRNPAYRQIFSRTFMPDATPQELEWFDEFQRKTTSPENAVRFLEAFSRIDVRDRLSEVKCPTLVVHSRHDQRIPFSSGRSLATRIKGARFAGIESNNHLLLGREPASSEFVSLIQNFLAV